MRKLSSMWNISILGNGDSSFDDVRLANRRSLPLSLPLSAPLSRGNKRVGTEGAFFPPGGTRCVFGARSDRPQSFSGKHPRIVQEIRASYRRFGPSSAPEKSRGLRSRELARRNLCTVLIPLSSEAEEQTRRDAPQREHVSAERSVRETARSRFLAARAVASFAT